MKQQLRIAALLLVLAMLFAFAGCTQEPPKPSASDPTTVPITTVPTPPPDPTPELAAQFTQAADLLREAEALTYRINATRVVKAAGQVFTESTQQDITYQGLGSGAFLASVNETTQYGDYELKASEIYADGTMYTDINEKLFSGEMTSEEYMARNLSAVLLDASLYSSISSEEVQGETVLTFHEPASGESWLVPEDTELISASGTARLDGQGNLTQCVYDVTFGYAGVEITYHLESTQESPAAAPRAPENKEEYTAVQWADGPRILEMAYGYLNQASQVSMTSNKAVVSQAAGFMMTDQTHADIYGAETEQMIQIKQEIQEVDHTGKTSELTVLELFKDGKFSYKQNDERPVTNSGITQSDMQDYFTNKLCENLLALDYIQDVECTDL